MGKYSPLSFHRASTICPHLLWLSAKASKVNNGTLNAQQPRSDVFYVLRQLAPVLLNLLICVLRAPRKIN